MCTPPRMAPGRCPVCGMELVAATSGNLESDGRSVQIDAVARRIANISTVAVKAEPLRRKIRAVGQLRYNEGTLKTIAAYVDGRLDRLYADYTGVVVKQGDHLALVYAPQLYSAQVELLVAGRARQQDRSVALVAGSVSGPNLYESARQRLMEFGMTRAQIEELEKTGEANSRMHLSAPISGTVIEKLAVEGQYLKTGQAIYRLADLSTVWLMLEMFPEDAAAVRYGQIVEAEVDSLPGQKVTGRVAFVDPEVDPQTRTVGVRVVVANEDGKWRVGDYAKATVTVRLDRLGRPQAEVFDPELADKWISPRHPHVIESAPGKCRLCGVDLVPATRFGYARQPVTEDQALIVPRSAVLMAGKHSVLYVETEPGRFEIRRVVLGPYSEDGIAILKGVEEGEQVAVSGNFLIDSQMQLAGNPSLIDPTKIQDPNETEEIPSAEVREALSALTEEDRALAIRQKICPVSGMPLGSMGPPPKVDVGGTAVLICCEGCRAVLLADPDKYLAKLATSSGEDSARTEGPASDSQRSHSPTMEGPADDSKNTKEPIVEATEVDP